MATRIDAGLQRLFTGTHTAQLASSLEAAAPEPTSTRRWVVVARSIAIAVTVALVASAALGGPSALALSVAPLAGAGASLAVLAGVRLHRMPLRRRASYRSDPWLLVSAGVAATSASCAMGAGRLSPMERPTPALAILLVGYGLLAAGLLRQFAARLAVRSADVMAQAGMAAALTALGSWAGAAALGADHRYSTWALFVTVALPALDAALLVVALRLLLLPGDRLFVCRAVCLAVGYQSGAHVASLLATATAWRLQPGLVPVLTACSFVLWAVAALDPSMRRLVEPLADEPASFSWAHLAVVTIGLLAAPLLILLSESSGERPDTAAALTVSALSVMLAIYVGDLLRQRGRMERSTLHDSLTGLPNRTLFSDRLSRALAHARRHGTTLAIIFVDLDHFKKVNDSLGHAAGDQLLVEVGGRLKACVRDEDTVARLGGDEFALLLPHSAGLDAVSRVGERILAAFRQPIIVAEQQLVVTPSMGASVFPSDGADAATLIEGADAAMYRAKENGRNTLELFNQALRTAAHERLELEAALHHAVSAGELVLHYQPKVDLATGSICGAEALVRWNHPERGLLLPGAFVPLAEQTGLVTAIGEFVIATACSQLRQWASFGFPDITVAVNVSARQLHADLADYVAAALRLSGVDPRRLELELTESAAVESLDATVAELAELRAIGVRCSIDDFGTGYCGLSYLSRLPVDALKIDKAFISTGSAAEASIMTAIIALGHSLGLRVVAEGVETAEQLAYLVAQGCDEMQGYLFSKPLPADEFTRLLVEQRPGGPGSLPTRAAPSAFVVAESRGHTAGIAAGVSER
jgi:diguanylate cyclase (GGDEF)-like protein